MPNVDRLAHFDRMANLTKPDQNYRLFRKVVNQTVGLPPSTEEMRREIMRNSFARTTDFSLYALKIVRK